MKKILVFLLCVMLTGCGLHQSSVCDDFQPGDSDLCAVAADMNVQLEEIGDVLIVANALAIGQGAYTVDQALVVLGNLRTMVDGPVSYVGVRNRVVHVLQKYPGLFVVGMVYLEKFNSPQIMKKADAEILKGWLDKQISILGG